MNWLQALAPSLFMVVGGIVTWLLKARIEELKAAEENLRETRTKTYWDILEPYIALFSDASDEGKANVIKMITSQQYRKTAFQLCLLGPNQARMQKEAAGE